MSVPNWILPCRLDSPRNASSPNRLYRWLDTQLCKPNSYPLQDLSIVSPMIVFLNPFEQRLQPMFIHLAVRIQEEQCVSPRLLCPKHFRPNEPFVLGRSDQLHNSPHGIFLLVVVRSQRCIGWMQSANLLIALLTYAIRSNRQSAEFLESARVDFDRWLNWPFESAQRETRWNSTQL